MWIYGYLTLFVFNYVIPFGGSVGASLLLVGLTRRWWAGLLLIPVAALGFRVLPFMGSDLQAAALVLTLLGNGACFLLRRDPEVGILTKRARKGTLILSGVILGVTVAMTIWWVIMTILFWTAVGRAGQ